MVTTVPIVLNRETKSLSVHENIILVSPDKHIISYHIIV